MIGRLATTLAFAGALSRAALAAPAEQAPTADVREVIADIQIHGNNATPEAEIVALAAVTRGDAFTSSTLDDVRRRLDASRRFERVDVRKRFASIADPSQVALVIIVDEYPVSILPALPGSGGSGTGPVRIVRRRFGGAMFLPILDGEDGYGLTYGALVAYADVVGKGSRVSLPLTWGGRKQAAVELDRPIPRGPIARLRAGVSIVRRTNPAFDQDDDRTRVWGRAETRVRANLRAGATMAREAVHFGEARETWRSAGADVTWDTRQNPVFPRNAVYAAASTTRSVSDTQPTVVRSTIDLRGYVGLVGAPVLVVSAERTWANRALPAYFKPLLGGWTNLRGFAAGSFVGDTRLTTSAELRVPVSSPLRMTRSGFSVFVDRGKAYGRDARFADEPWHTGVGAGVWLSATVVRAGVSVAKAVGGGVRVNVGLSVDY